VVGSAVIESGWEVRHGSWYMVQWGWEKRWGMRVPFAGWLSFGVHIDTVTRHNNRGCKYGPYVDLHAGLLVISVGRNPYYSSEYHSICGHSRGGVSGNSN
jgi:hypothetical protein